VEWEEPAAHDLTQKVSNIFDYAGEYRLPQRSNTAYCRCILEVFTYMLRRRGVSDLYTQYINLGLAAELVCMAQNDMGFILPDENGVRVCHLALRELSSLAVKLVNRIDDSGVSESKSSAAPLSAASRGGDEQDGVLDEDEDDRVDETMHDGEINAEMVLDGIHQLVESMHHSLSFCKPDDATMQPFLDLNEPTPTQYRDIYCWDTPPSEPDPGQAVQLRKYLPVDFMQIPKKADTRRRAIEAIRFCDRLCTLLDNQSHCIKNDKFLIAATIEHVFTQVLPVPKPRGINRTEAEMYSATRSERVAARRKEEERTQAEEKKRKLEEAEAKEKLKATV
jgi:hypothetical protein